MPVDVQVHITDATVISALNTPGGDVYTWRNDTESDLLAACVLDSPIGDVLNTLHDSTRPPIGDYAASWVTRRQGNGHRVGFQIENFSDHAIYVEEGRGASRKQQTFSWAVLGGQIITVGGRFGGGTAARDGEHILRDATNRVLARATGGSYAPLP